MMILDGNYPDADSTEVSQCYKTKDTGGIQFSLGATNGILKQTYRVAVLVCDRTVLGLTGLESNCDRISRRQRGYPALDLYL